MASKDGVIFPTPAIKDLACSDSVSHITGREQGRANNEHFAVMLWCVWLLLRNGRDAQEQGQKDVANCVANWTAD